MPRSVLTPGWHVMLTYMGALSPLWRGLELLRDVRPIFHSEADFQHGLAWAIHESDPSLRVRLETRPAPGMRLDLLISSVEPQRYLALELKYLTDAWAGDVDGERYRLVSQGA